MSNDTIVYKNTERLFWKKWPYKIVLGDPRLPRRDHFTGNVLTSSSSRLVRFDSATYSWTTQFVRWFKSNFEGHRIRREIDISVFLDSDSQVKQVVDAWGKHVREVWSPVNQAALQLMKEHTYDVVRERPWFNEYSLRIGIPYTHDFTNHGLETFRHAVDQIDSSNWRATGLLLEILHRTNVSKTKLPYPGGQTLYLYLSDIEDVMMLKLQLAGWISRVERQRSPV